jgi:hypothetical protein
MKQIEKMISETANDLKRHRVKSRTDRNESWALPWLSATRLHALLDCYVALGGNIDKWRNEANVLKQDF